MKKQLLISLIIICISANVVISQSHKKYSAMEVKTDLEYLRKTMEASNYDFYALTNKTIMDSAYAGILNSIEDSLTYLQVFRLFQPYVVMAKMSHCYLAYPWNEYEKYNKLGGTVFPLRLYFNDGKVFVRANFSKNELVEENDEIVSFDGKPIHEMMDKMYWFISGPTEYFKNSQIEQREFARLFWFFFDKQNEFSLKIRKKDGQELTITLLSILGNEFEEKMKTQKSLLQFKRGFRIIEDLAYLHPGHFLNDIPFDPSNPALFDNTEFCRFTDSAFHFFNRMKAKSLIIDLRYNPGGDNSFSDYMISYIADKPFSFTSKFSIKTSQITKEWWKKVDAPEHQELKKQIMSLENGTYFNAQIPLINPHPDSIRYKGNVYVIINRYSYSNTSSVASIIQDYKFGEIVGEETAEVVSSYGGVHSFELPNTNWNVVYPKALGVRPNGDASQRGVIPDYPIDEDIFTDTDEVLEYTLNLIKNED
jgi:C-terminal processing protease CtpA/Prc